MARFVDRQRFGERDDGALAGDVIDRAGLADGRHQAGHVDDVPSRPTQVRQRQSTGGELADEIEVEQLAELADGDRVDGAMREVRAGVVDQAVEPTVPFDDGGNGCGDGLFATDIGKGVRTRRTERGGQRLAAVLVVGHGHDPCSLTDEGAYHAFADTPGSTGHHDHSICVAHARIFAETRPAIRPVT